MHLSIARNHHVTVHDSETRLGAALRNEPMTRLAT
jgi:hypothetical protein